MDRIRSRMDRIAMAHRQRTDRWKGFTVWHRRQRFNREMGMRRRGSRRGRHHIASSSMANAIAIGIGMEIGHGLRMSVHLLVVALLAVAMVMVLLTVSMGMVLLRRRWR